MKKTKSKQHYLAYLLSILSLVTLFFIEQSVDVKAADTTIPGPSILESGVATVPKADETVDGKYATLAEFTGKTEVSLYGPSANQWSQTPDNVAVLRNIQDSDKGKMGALYTNVATQKGQQLDLAVIATDWMPGVTEIGFRTDSIGVKIGNPAGDTDLGIGLQTKFVYLNHNTHQPVTVNGFYTFNDVDAVQSLTFSPEFTKNIDKMYVPTSQTILKSEVVSGADVIYAGSTKLTDDDDPSSQFTILYSDADQMDVLFTDNRMSKDLTMKLPGKYVGKLSTESKVDYANADPIDNITNKDTEPYGRTYFGYMGYKPLRTKTTTPAKTVSDSDELDVIKNTLQSADEENKWSLTQTIPQEYSQFYYSSAYFSDAIDPAFTVVSWTVTNESGKDVSSWFDNQGTGNNLKVAATAAKLSSSDFYGHTYKLKVTGKLRKTGNFSEYLQPNGDYVFPNVGSFTTDTGTEPTNPVKTILKHKNVILPNTGSKEQLVWLVALVTAVALGVIAIVVVISKRRNIRN